MESFEPDLTVILYQLKYGFILSKLGRSVNRYRL